MVDTNTTFNLMYDLQISLIGCKRHKDYPETALNLPCLSLMRWVCQALRDPRASLIGWRLWRLIQVHFNPKPYNLPNWWFELVGCYQPLHEGHFLHVVRLYVLSLSTMMRSSEQIRTLTP